MRSTRKMSLMIPTTAEPKSWSPRRKEKPEGGGRKKTKPKGVWHSVSMDVWHPLTRPMPSGGVHFDFLLGKSCFGLQLTKKSVSAQPCFL